MKHRCYRGFRIHTAGLIFLFLFPLQASALSFYSVNSETNQLVRIDAGTGAASVIGPLGVDTSDVDLTVVGGRLFALDRHFGAYVDLLELNPLTGTVITSARVTSGGAQILSAEGLTHVGGTLKIGFDENADTVSDLLGDLATDGSITNSKRFSADFDGLGVGSADQIYSVDVEPAANTTKFYRVDPANLAVFEIASFSNELTVNDVEVVGNDLFGVDDLHKSLFQISLDDGSLRQVITLDGPYFGLAIASTIPEPSTLTLNKLGLGSGRVTSQPPGIDCGTNCPSQTATFAQLTHITLTAQADSGSTFMGWSGGGCSGTETCELTMGTDPVTVTAQFVRQSPGKVPSLSEWGIIVLFLVLVGSSFWTIRRRRA